MPIKEGWSTFNRKRDAKRREKLLSGRKLVQTSTGDPLYVRVCVGVWGGGGFVLWVLVQDSKQKQKQDEP